MHDTNMLPFLGRRLT